MQHEPAVSVVVCFLDEERFLGEALASVQDQSFTDWELLLVDDGSTDGSSGIARAQAAADPARVRYVEHAGHSNLGLSASRNAGIALARGRYLAFLDADDSWYPRKLEEQVAILERHPRAAMVIGASQYWRSWDAPSGGADETIRVGAQQDTLIEPPALMTALYPLGTGASPPPSDLLLRSDAVRAVGGFEATFRGPLMLYEDQAFLSKVYRRYPVYVAGACWDRYRRRADSIVATHGSAAAGRYWEVRSHFLAWLQRDLARTGDTSADVEAALGRALRRARLQRARARLASAVRGMLPAAVYERLRPRSPATR
jgi:glycosyltransferase involved in cell wall biosynthesis